MTYKVQISNPDWMLARYSFDTIEDVKALNDTRIRIVETVYKITILEGEFWRINDRQESIIGHCVPVHLPSTAPDCDVWIIEEKDKSC